MNNGGQYNLGSNEELTLVIQAYAPGSGRDDLGMTGTAAPSSSPSLAQPQRVACFSQWPPQAPKSTL